MNKGPAMSTTEARPWHREPWPWMLMAGPAAVMVAGTITAALAVLGADGLVADDYYKQGVAINRTLARENRARVLALHGALTFGDARVLATLEADGRLPDRIALRLAHATRASADRTAVLARDASGRYSAPLAGVPPGRWSVILETADWRVATSAEVHAGGVVRISAGGR